MTKAPRAGAVKTRLQPPLTADEAATLNACFLSDTAAAIAAAGECTCGVGVYTPPGTEELYADILPSEFYLLPQRGNDFGERLKNAMEDLLRAGFESCCLIDSDTPTVPAEVYRRAAEQLHGSSEQVVIGPCEDGGYYLIGMARVNPAMFDGIDWSTDRVLSQTIDRANMLGLQVYTLQTFFDVDDRTSLRHMWHELMNSDGKDAPATSRFLRQMLARDGSRILGD